MTIGSSPRRGATVRVACLHTAEGARTARSLAAFFAGDVNASSHVCIDASETLWIVPRDRAAWTLLSGNPISMNAELCGFARWNRRQWLSTGTVDGVVNPKRMLDRAADWLRGECDHFGLPYDKLEPVQLANGSWGIIHHLDWTEGMGEGTHWDCGYGIPWDYILRRVRGGSAPVSDHQDYPLPSGHYYGPIDGPEESHGGYYARERPVVRMIQQKFQELGHAPSDASWADGLWEPPTTDAARAWQTSVGLPVTGTVDADDWRALFPAPRKDSDMGAHPTALPQTQEWSKAVFPVECRGKSAMVDQLWFSLGSAYGSTDFVLVIEGDGTYHGPLSAGVTTDTPGEYDEISQGRWDGDDPIFSTVPSGRRATFELPEAADAISLYYRNHGNSAAGYSFPQTPK